MQVLLKEVKYVVLCILVDLVHGTIQWVAGNKAADAAVQVAFRAWLSSSDSQLAAGY